MTRIDPDNNSEQVWANERGELSFLKRSLEKSFTPGKEGYYVIEVHFNGTESSLAPEDFSADDSVRIKAVKSIAGAQVSGITDKVFNGQEQTQNSQDIIVSLNERTLVPDTDYEISSYADNVAAGQATVTINGKGFYKGMLDAHFQIFGMPIPEDAVSDVPDAVYSGKAIEPEPSVLIGGQTLVKDTDYVLSYENNTKAGSASVIISGQGNYSGTVSRAFAIRPVSIRKATIPMINDRKNTGQPVEPYPSVKFNGYGISRDIDFTMSYSNNIEPGTASVVFTGIGNFKDSVTRTFTILEPTASSGGNTFSSVILSPKDLTEYPVGAQITVTAKATNFYYNYYTGLSVETNFLYFKVTRNGEEILYKRVTLKPNTGEVSQTFIADTAGKYVIQTEWDDCYLDSSGTYTPISSEAFSPDTSISVYVGTPAPERSIKDIASAVVTGVTDKPYTGNAVTQTPVVKLDGKTLAYGTDYYLTYLNNFNIGPAAVKVHGKEKYSGSTDYMTFQITACPLSSDMISLSPASVIYNGSVQKPAVTVKHGTFTLDENTDYTLVNAGGTEPGSYQVTISAASDSNYSGSASKTFKISGFPLDHAAVTASPASYTYDGVAKTPSVTVKLDGKTLSAQDYTVSFKNNTNAGTSKVTITAKAGTYYTGSASASFTINKKDISASDISTAAIADKTYARKALTPVPAVKFGDRTLTSGTDYQTSYSSNTNAGTAKITISGKGNYTGSRTLTFRILPKEISGPSITAAPIESQTYTKGNLCCPPVTVKDGNTALTSDDYSLEYQDNDRPGTAKVIISGKGNYSGSRSDVTFTILSETQQAIQELTDRIDEIEQEIGQGDGKTNDHAGSGAAGISKEDQQAIREAIDSAKELIDKGKADTKALQDALKSVNEARETAEKNAQKNAGSSSGGKNSGTNSQNGTNAQTGNTSNSGSSQAQAGKGDQTQTGTASQTGKTQTGQTFDAGKNQANVRAQAEQKAAAALPAAAATEKKILAQKSDKDPAGSSFAPL